MYNDLTLLAMARTKMDWAARRQEVLARNVANADTPGFRPSDLKPLDFKEALRQAQPVAAAVTHPSHVSVQPSIRPPDAVKERKPFDTAPDGNAVDLEEQMYKVGEVRGQHSLAADIFGKYVKLLKIALGKATA